MVLHLFQPLYQRVKQAMHTLTYLRVTISFLALVVCSSVYSQTPPPVPNASQSHPAEAKVQALILEGRSKQFSDTTTAIGIFKEAMALTDEHNLLGLRGYTRIGVAIMYSYIGQHTEAINFVENALIVINKETTPFEKLFVIRQAGFIFSAASRQEKAVYYYQLAIQTYQESNLDEPGQLAQLYLDTATVYQQSEQYESALDYTNKALTIKQTLGFWIFRELFQMADIYNDQGKHTDALPFAQSMLQNAIDAKNDFAISQGQMLLGDTHLGLNHQDSSETHSSLAEMHYTKALEFSNTLPVKRIDHLLKLIGLASVEFLKEKYDIAEQRFLEALELALRIEAKNEEAIIRMYLANYYRETQPQKAIKHLEARTLLMEILAGQTFSSELASLMTEFEITRQENELNKSRLDNIALEKRNATMLYFGVLLATVLILATGFMVRLVMLKRQNTSLEKMVNERTQQLQASQEKYKDMFKDAMKEKSRIESALALERSSIENNLNFLDMFSHEYKKPLAVLDSSIQILQQDGHSISALLERMGSSTRKLLHLFESTLKEQRTGDDFIYKRLQKVRVTNLISVLVDYQRQVFENHMIVLNSNIEPSLEMDLDPDLINIAFSNLVDNACKYSDGDAPITITVSRNQTNQKTDNQKTDNTPAPLLITIEDKGEGIEQKDIPKLFEKYFRANNDSDAEGHGVGLFLVKRIIEMHQGTITIESIKGEQTQVSVELPVFNEKKV